MGITAVDSAVPRSIAGALRSAIIALDARRRDAGTHWYALDAPARSLFEQVIQHLRTLVPHGDAFVGAEWWFRATTTDMGFPFHFDRDEAIRDTVVSPALATILYLGNAGGPTIVVEATPSRTTAPRFARAVYPRAGRFAMFPGTFLHGVLPGRPGRWPRVTMLVNWWRTVPRLERVRPPAAALARPWRSITRDAALEAIDPARLLANAAWRDLISKQASYR